MKKPTLSPTAPAIHAPAPAAELLSRPLALYWRLDWEKTAYLVMVLLALLTRLWGLGDRVASHDESLHTQYSYQFYIGDGYRHTPLMHGPFLFHITALSYWLFGGANDFTARLPVALFGVVLVLVPTLLRDWIGRKGALFASFALLISPAFTYYSRYIRHDIYVITWAMIVFVATWYYLRQRQERYLWWFAAGTALMFSTKEVAFIYVAVFGSFLALRLLLRLAHAPLFFRSLRTVKAPLALLAVALLLLGAGFGGQRLSSRQAQAQATATATSQGFAVDPNATIAGSGNQPATPSGLRLLQLGGLAALGAGLFLLAHGLRRQLDEYPEFDLIVLFSALILPLVSPLVITLMGWDPQSTTFNRCFPPGFDESSTGLPLLLARLGNSTCYQAFFSSDLVRSSLVLALMLLIGVLVGLWWHRRRFLTAAIIFHAIFLILYTSVFTNPSGWTSGMIGSLGYWLAQQKVARGSQPWFYYLFLLPVYEFLPLIFSLLAVRYWAAMNRLHKIAGYWLTLALLALLLGNLADWLANGPARAAGLESSNPAGMLLAGALFLAGILYWFLVRQGQLRSEYGLKRKGPGLVTGETFTGFVPAVTWWLVVSFAMYSYAGEKMPWLIVHFSMPMSLLLGWYMQQRLEGVNWRQLARRESLALVGLTCLLLVALALALAPLLLGKVRLGDQAAESLSGVGRFLGSLAVAGILATLWWRQRAQAEPAIRQRLFLFSGFLLLALVTARFSYMANFPNADYTTEFIVYAHGAPATKNSVMKQVEELSLRLYGDKSIRVAFDNDSSWPFTWYLRDYPNRVYFDESPSRSLADSPVVIVGNRNWAQVEPFLGDDYVVSTQVFLWWPMEEYRRLGWAAFLGDPAVPREQRRGLGNPAVRQALWDIFWYRDYTRYGQVFGGNYSAGQWPLRHELRLYIRKDVYAQMWDYGIGAASYQPPVDPYAANNLALTPSGVFGLDGGPDDRLRSPRNVAIGPDGNLYVVDSGNHRLVVFNQDGERLRSWGSFGSEPGQFNEPWGVAVDDQFVYVADTWNHRLQKFTTTGQLVKTIGQGGSPSETDEGGGLFFGPRDVLLLGDDRLLVTDTGNHRLQLFDREGNFIAQYGRQGVLLGQMHEPVGIGLAPDGDLYLADTWNGRIQRFLPDLTPASEWRVEAWAGESIENKPYLVVDEASRVFVTDPEGYRVLIFDQGGQYLARFGQFGAELDAFALPNGLALDGEGNLYVADAGNNRIVKFAAADFALLSPPSPAEGEAGGGGG